MSESHDIIKQPYIKKQTYDTEIDLFLVFLLNAWFEVLTAVVMNCSIFWDKMPSVRRIISPPSSGLKNIPRKKTLFATLLMLVSYRSYFFFYCS
jgi:hypothetical protein